MRDLGICFIHREGQEIVGRARNILGESRPRGKAMEEEIITSVCTCLYKDASAYPHSGVVAGTLNFGFSPPNGEWKRGTDTKLPAGVLQKPTPHRNFFPSR